MEMTRALDWLDFILFHVNKEKAVNKTVNLLMEMFDKLSPIEIERFQ